jgi:hypothetical protein
VSLWTISLLTLARLATKDTVDGLVLVLCQWEPFSARLLAY